MLSEVYLNIEPSVSSAIGLIGRYYAYAQPIITYRGLI